MTRSSRAEAPSRGKKQSPQRWRPTVEMLESRDLLTITAVPVATLMSGGLGTDFPGTMMLLPNGKAMIQGSTGAGGVSNKWYTLSPDAAGSYVNGTWGSLASMGTQRLYFGSAVLPSDKVVVVGGEYSGASGAQNVTNTGEIYNLATNSWSPIANFPQGNFGDDPLTVLAAGPQAGDVLGG